MGRTLNSQTVPAGEPAISEAVAVELRHGASVSPSEVSRASGIPVGSVVDELERLAQRRLVVRLEFGRFRMAARKSRGLL